MPRGPCDDLLQKASNPLNDNQALRNLGEEELTERLVAAADSRTRHALAAELLGRHRRTVYLWCFRHVRDHEAALDLAQDVLLRAYERLESFRGNARFSTWLFVVARNVCLAARRRFEPEWAPEIELEGLVSSDPGPEETFFRQEDQEQLLRLMRSHLSETERNALWMRGVERIAVETITEELGLENATGARALLQRARRKLRAALREEGEVA